MRTIKIIFFTIVGFALGLSFGYLVWGGYFEQWERLASPPQEVYELVPTGAPPLFIKTIDGSTYKYSSWHGEGWIEEEIPFEITSPFDVLKPCNISPPEFSFLSRPPPYMEDCFQEVSYSADGYIQYGFILDNQGDIWEWEHSNQPMDMFVLLSFSGFGLLAGLVIGFLFTSGFSRK